MLGSILGCGLGIGLIESFTFFTAKSDGAIFKIIVDSQTVYFSLGLAICVGIAAALIPARSSVKLNPIEVIRNG